MADEEGRLNGAVEQEEENTEGATDKKDEEQTEKRSDEKDEVTIQENGSEEHNKENSTQEDVAEMDTTEKEEEVASSDKSKVVGTSAEEKNEDKEDAAVVTNGEEVEGRRQETEVDTETKESQKVTTSESSRSETSIETSAPVQIVSKETEASADQSEESKDQEPEEEDAAVEKTSSTQAEVVEEQQPEPQPETEEDQKPAESVEKVDEAVAEISEPEIKAQLEEIIKEIDDTVDKEDVGEEKQEEGAEEEQVYHTWKPKGKYEIEATPILREDVVPIDVAEVPEPPPVELPPPVTSTDTQESANDTSRMMQQQEPIGPITVPQLLPNGELGSPIEIPEGIPLLARILPKEEGHDRAPIPLERLFTPATDSGEITPRKKKAFASSDFYAPNHPTIDDQLQLAQNISKSLIDQNNKTSRGQAMYEKRKQRSVKWIHQEGGKLVQQEVEEEEEATGTDFVEMNDEQPKVTKPAMKLVMNPKGVQDHTTVEQHYQQLMEQSNMSSSNMSPGQMPASPEIVRDIITDMQSPTGKGAALFAKRKKRMDKFIVDETNVQKSSAYQQEQQSCVQSTTTERSTVNQFSSFSSSSNSSSTTNQPQKTGPLASSIPVSNKKKSLQERDKEQQRIMEEFMKNRESQFQIVKTPWEAVLETGNTSAAFKQNMQTKSSTMTTTINAVSGPAVPGGAAAPPWLEMPQPVPVTAPLPRAAPSAPLPTPPSPFGKQAAGPPANGPLNNPATLPDISTILTSSSSSKSKSLTPQPSSAAAKPSGLNVKPALALDNNRASNLLSKSTTRSPRSSSVGNRPQEKRLSTLPNAAKYPFPSYLNIASKPSGYLRSSSASSIPALAEAFANDSSVAAKSTDDLTETFPFLKPGTPPIVVVPGVEGEPSALANGLQPNENLSWIAQVETKKVVKQQQPDFTSEVKLRKVKSRDTTSRIASGGTNNTDAQNGTENLLNCQNASASSTSFNFGSSIAAASSSSLPSYNFVSKAPAEKGGLQSFTKNDAMRSTSASTSQVTRPSQLSALSTTSNPPSFCSVVPSLRSAPADVGLDNSYVDAFNNRGSASVLTNTRQMFSENTSNFLQSSEPSVDNIEQKSRSAPYGKTTQKSVSEHSDGHSSSAFRAFQTSNSKVQEKVAKNFHEPLQLNNTQFKPGTEVDNQKQPSGLNSPIRYAKVNDLNEPPTATHFASAYIMSPPKVDKKIHMFDFANDDDKEVKILLNEDNEDPVSDHELNTFVSEIQRSFSATPIAVEAISVDDLQPPEFFRSVSRNEDRTDEADLITIDDTYEEHGVVTSNIFQKKAASQVCTVSKAKVMNRDSACPSNLTLKQQAVSNLEVLSAFSARDKSPLNEQSGSVSDKGDYSSCSIQAVPAPTDLSISMLGSGVNKLQNKTEKISSSFNATKSVTAKVSTHSFSSDLTKLESLSNTNKADESETLQYSSPSEATKPGGSGDISSVPNQEFTSKEKQDVMVTDSTKGPNFEPVYKDEISPDSNGQKIEDFDTRENQSQNTLDPSAKEVVLSANPGTSTMNAEPDAKIESLLVGTEASSMGEEPTLPENTDFSKVEVDVRKSVPKSDEIEGDVTETSEKAIDIEAINSPSKADEFASTDPTITDVGVEENVDSSPSEIVKVELESVVFDLSASQVDKTDTELKVEESHQPISSDIDDKVNEVNNINESKISPIENSQGLKSFDLSETGDNQSLELNIKSSETEGLNDDGDTASVAAAPLPLSLSKADPPPTEGAGGTGLVYTAEVKVQQPSGQPKGQNFQPSAPAPLTPPAPVAKPAAAAPPSQPLFAAPVATKPAPVVTKPAPVVTKPVPSPSAGGIGGPGFVSQAEAEERRKSMNFNLAANGWGNYNKYYRPISFAS